MKVNDENIEQLVLEEASRLVFESGIRSWNMDDLAQRAGLAKNTLYKIIGSKEDLLLEVLSRHIHSVQSKLLSIINSETDYLAALQKITSLFPELLCGVYADCFKEVFTEYPRIEKSIREHKDEITRSIILFIQTGRDCGALKQDIKPEIVFELFQAIVLYYLKAGMESHVLSDHLSEAFAHIMHGLITR